MATKKKIKSEESSYSFKSYRKGDKIIAEITCDPLNMKNLLYIMQEIYTVVVHMNSDYSKKIGFLQGFIDAIKLNQESLNSNFLRIETELFKLKNKPWWRRFLGL